MIYEVQTIFEDWDLKRRLVFVGFLVKSHILADKIAIKKHFSEIILYILNKICLRKYNRIKIITTCDNSLFSTLNSSSQPYNYRLLKQLTIISLILKYPLNPHHFH